MHYLETDTDGNNGGSDSSLTRLWDDVEGVQLMGELVGINGAGRMRFWVNTQKFRDWKDQEQYLMNQKAVMGISSAIEGVKCFGAILDKSAGAIVTGKQIGRAHV